MSDNIRRPISAKPSTAAASIALAMRNKASFAISERDLRGCSPEAAAYAAKVWGGQSHDLPVRERVSRVVKALKGQGIV